MENQTLVETRCPDCEGSGIESYFADRDEHGPFRNGDPCAACDGTGHVPAPPAGPEHTTAPEREGVHTEQLEIVDAATGELEGVCSIAEFCAANVDAPDLCDGVRALAVGEACHAGGGAAPWITIKRVR